MKEGPGTITEKDRRRKDAQQVIWNMGQDQLSYGEHK